MILLSHQKRLTSFWLGRACVFCSYRKTFVTARGYVKCARCGKQKSLKRLRRELEIICAFVEQRPALQVSVEMKISYQKVVSFAQIPSRAITPSSNMAST